MINIYLNLSSNDLSIEVHDGCSVEVQDGRLVVRGKKDRLDRLIEEHGDHEEFNSLFELSKDKEEKLKIERDQKYCEHLLDWA